MTAAAVYYKLCKYGCNTEIGWDKNLSKFLERNGTVHDRVRCESQRGKGGEEEKKQPQVQPQPQEQTRYDSAYLIPKEDWERMQDYIGKIDAQLTRLSEFYDSIMQEIEALRGMAFEQQSYRRHQQQLADSEVQYDQDKEDGRIGSG